MVQSMPDVSPAKWHLAHTTWFFEQFVLLPFLEGYRVFNEDYHYLFNSYYQSAGSLYPRPRRGLLSRPLVREIRAYREHVEAAVTRLLEQDEREEPLQRTRLGLNHEQQHQELLLTDIKHVFSCNPLGPAVIPNLPEPMPEALQSLQFEAYPGGEFRIGHSGDGFCFDNETPRHRVLLQPYELANRLVTNGDYREFIDEGGYRDHRLWLSDGWDAVREHAWESPLYWDAECEREFTLGGWREINPDAPVTHVSFYEADAFARWRGARLPTEQEWERAAAGQALRGNLMQTGLWHPAPAPQGEKQFYGDCWEWTASPYAPYPGFKPLAGSLGEYNGKFMCNQMSVRGGSCVTADDHIRPSYRSFFYPEARWQFLGIRLARDIA